LTFHRITAYNVFNKRRIQTIIVYVGSDYLSFIEWRNKRVWALTKSFEILDISTNLQELFLNSYFKVVLHFYSSIVTFLQFISNVNHIKLYCLLFDVSRNRICPFNGYKDWLNCFLKIQLPYNRRQFSPLLRSRVTNECLRRHNWL